MAWTPPKPADSYDSDDMQPSLASLGPETCWCDIIADHGGGLRERDQAWDGGHPFGSLVSSINSSGVIDLIASR